MGSIIVEKSLIKSMEDMYNEKISEIFNGNDNTETDLALEILYDLYHFCIDYLKVNDLEAEIVNVKLLVLVHRRLVEMIEHRNNIKDEFEKVSNDIFLNLIKCT